MSKPDPRGAPIVACRAGDDYTLTLTFADGLRGTVSVARLLDIGCFKYWRELAYFKTARPDLETGDLVWANGGVRLHYEILHQAVEAEGGVYGPKPKTARPAFDPGYYRFMARALEPVKLTGKRKPR